MNLGDLIDFVGNLLDYDPTNDTYRSQLVALLNDSQTRVLTDRIWDFAQREKTVKVWTDLPYEMVFVNGSATVTGVGFDASTSTVTPGSTWDQATITFTDGAGDPWTHKIAWVEDSTTLYLDRIYRGGSGTYTATIARREVYLPADTMSVMNVSDPSVGTPSSTMYLSKFERDALTLDSDQLGRVEAWVPSEGTRVSGPQITRGVATVTGVSQGVRTINVYYCNVLGPSGQNSETYPTEVSSGFESAFGKVETYELSDIQTLEFTPEVLPNTTGLYRRYYFTCPEANILAPVRIRNADGEGAVAVDVDTVNPKGTITLKPDLSLSIISGQAFHSTSIRYVWNQSGVYQSMQLYPHPSGDQDIDCRVLISPSKMQEDQDVPLVPASYAQIVAYAALEQLTLKVDNPALSAVYMRKKDVLFKGMEQRFLGQPARIIRRGGSSQGFVRNPFGPLKFTP